MADELDDESYRALAAFRYELRRFLHFSENAARGAGLTPQQHQALLAIRAAPGGEMLVGELAERLLLRPHSASELAARLEGQGLAMRQHDAADRRQVHLRLTKEAMEILTSLTVAHRAELRRSGPLLHKLLEEL